MTYAYVPPHYRPYVPRSNFRARFVLCVFFSSMFSPNDVFVFPSSPLRCPSYRVHCDRVNGACTAGELAVLVGPDHSFYGGVHHPTVLQRGDQSLRSREHSGERSGAGLGEPRLLGGKRLLVGPCSKRWLLRDVNWRRGFLCCSQYCCTVERIDPSLSLNKK